MADDIALRESRLARRLGRLFRVERGGGFARHSPRLTDEVLRRRGVLIDELVATETDRRAQGLPSSPELRAAVEDLSRELVLSRRCVDARVEELTAELRAARGEGGLSGIRNGPHSRVIGRG